MGALLNFLGIDPDTERPALAVVQADIAEPAWSPRLTAAAIVRLPKEPIRAGYREFTSTEACIRELCLRMPQWLVKQGQISACVVEGQIGKQRGHASPDPEDIIELAAVSGAAMAIARAYCQCECYRATSQEWKGSKPKGICHLRTYEALGIPHKAWKKRKDDKGPPFYLPLSEEARLGFVKESPSPTNPGDWEDISDAVALAYWLACRWREVKLGLDGALMKTEKR